MLAFPPKKDGKLLESPWKLVTIVTIVSKLVYDLFTGRKQPTFKGIRLPSTSRTSQYTGYESLPKKSVLRVLRIATDGKYHIKTSPLAANWFSPTTHLPAEAIS